MKHGQEFDCMECGQHIVRIVADPHMPPLCAHCIFIPGWFRHPNLRALLAPEGLPDLPDHEKGDDE